MARRYEFYFRVAKTIFYERAPRVAKTIFYERAPRVSKILFCHSKIKFISSSRRVMFFLLYRHADDGVFDDFPKISEHFQKVFRRPDERSRTFSENFRRCQKMSEDCRRLSRKTRRCFDDTPTNLSTISETNLLSMNDTTLIKVTYGKYATRVPGEVAYGIYEWFNSHYNIDRTLRAL